METQCVVPLPNFRSLITLVILAWPKECHFALSSERLIYLDESAIDYDFFPHMNVPSHEPVPSCAAGTTKMRHEALALADLVPMGRHMEVSVRRFGRSRMALGSTPCRSGKEGSIDGR